MGDLMSGNLTVFVGFDPREAAGYAVARYSLRRRMTVPLPIFGIVLADLQRSGAYTRPISRARNAMGHPLLWDVLSDAPMSTEHANARFLVPYLAKSGWALFVDGDILALGNVNRLFENLDPGKALYCVQHEHVPIETTKMDGQPQTKYSRKNWSSVMMFNVDHPANKALTREMVNKLPGRDLHRFCWLEDDQIGALGPEWNFLVGISPPIKNPQIIHFTEGLPDMAGYEKCEYADEWRAELIEWAAR